MVITAVISSYSYYQMPIAYIDIDINLSIELGINRWNRIVSAKGYNSDGENILRAKTVLNKELQKGIKEIIQTANTQGFFTHQEGSAVSLTTMIDGLGKGEDLIEICKEIIEDYAKEEKINIEIVTAHLELQRRESAKEIGITAGKIHLINKLQDLDNKVTIEAYKDYPVKEIVKQIKELKKVNIDDSIVEDETGELDKKSKEQVSKINTEELIDYKEKSKTKKESEHKRENKPEDKQEDKTSIKQDNKQESSQVIDGGKQLDIDEERKSNNTLKNKDNNKQDNNQQGNQQGNKQENKSEIQKPRK